MSEQFLNAPASGSIRLIDFERAEVVEGFIPGTYFLVVWGTKPYVNMLVELSPLIYVTRPDYWGIEVIGSLPGFGLPAEAPYSVSIPLDGILGTEGIEVIGASKREKIPVPDRLTSAGSKKGGASSKKGGGGSKKGGSSKKGGGSKKGGKK